jgi:hypothetical protein
MVGTKRKNDGAEQNADAKDTQPRLYGFLGVYVFEGLSRDLRRAFARSMQSASATLESPLESSKHIIAQLLRTVQCSLMQRFQLSAPAGISAGPMHRRRTSSSISSMT